MSLKLFSRQDCPLCEDVEELLLSLAIEFEYIDIDESDELLKKYHTQVPVLMNSKGDSLNWPFEESQLMSFKDE